MRLAEAIEARFPSTPVVRETEQDGTVLEVSPARLVEVCEFLRDDPAARCDLLVALTIAPGYALVQLVSTSRSSRLRVRVPRDGDGEAIDSLAFVWPAANWAEREAHDLWGTTFRGHPAPTPLLKPAQAPLLTPQADNGAFMIGGTRYPTSVDGLSVTIEAENERILKASPSLGTRHCGVGKRLTEWKYGKGTWLAARLDGFSAMACDLAYAMAVERLLQLQPPPRAQGLRVIYGELQRIASHLYWLARCVQTLADPPFAAPAYAWQARSAILEFFQWLGGNPITPDVIAIGGLHRDTPEGFDKTLRRLAAALEAWLDDVEGLLAGHSGFRARLSGTGVIDPGTALGLGVTGPCLRACGTGYDVRRAFPYADYGSLEIDVPVEQGCDAEARYRNRMAEMRVSLGLVRQAMARLVSGPVNALSADRPLPTLPEKTAYASVEGPRGELGMLVVAENGTHLKHVHVRGPSFANLSALPFLSSGAHPDQLAPILDSLDISMGEVER